MSKASEYADIRKGAGDDYVYPPAFEMDHPGLGIITFCVVCHDGSLELLYSPDVIASVSPENALSLARWIIDTFGDAPAESAEAEACRKVGEEAP